MNSDVNVSMVNILLVVNGYVTLISYFLYRVNNDLEFLVSRVDSSYFISFGFNLRKLECNFVKIKLIIF